MKKIIFSIALLLLLSAVINAQTKPEPPKVKADTFWKSGGFASFNFNQVSLSNWAAGGESSLSFTSFINGFANYKKNKTTWDNSISLGYGILKSNGNPIRKNEDKLEFGSKLGHLAKGKFFYAALMTFRTQFDDGYNYPNQADMNQKVFVSKFFTPAYLIISIGMDYKPTDFLSFYLSPATGRFIFVNSSNLADAGAYGVDPAEYDASGNKIKKGRTSKAEFGAYFNGKFQKDIMKNVNLMSKISLFDNYTDPKPKKRANIVVNWEVMVGMKINKYLAANIYTNLIYDDRIMVPTKYSDDKKKVEESGPRTQFKEVLGIGFSYKF